MSVNPHQLRARYKGTIEHLRRQQDNFFDFFHRDSPLREPWHVGLEAEIFRSQPALLERPGMAERVQWGLRRAPHNIRDALFFLCITRVPSLRDFLGNPDEVEHFDIGRLRYFLANTLPPMTNDFLAGRDGTLGPDSYVREVRVRYSVIVGFHPQPLVHEQERQEARRAAQDEERVYGGLGAGGQRQQ